VTVRLLVWTNCSARSRLCMADRNLFLINHIFIHSK
jgi:hypothetical protein